MTFKTPIRARVDAAGLLSKIDRMFDASPVTVFSELLQNSRRAGATKVVIGIENRHVSYHDDGHGVEDPGVLLSLAARGWGDEIQDCEDPAGMGFFCLSSFPLVHVRSRGWEGTLSPQVFRGELEFEVTDKAGDWSGFQALWEWQTVAHQELVDGAIKATAFCGIGMVEVHHDGKITARPATDYLHDCVATEYPELGVRIGVPSDSYCYRRAPEANMNFKGVLIIDQFEMESTKLTSDMARFRVKVDVLHSKHLKLVLPARNALMHGPGRDALHQALRLEIYKHIARTRYGKHSFRYEVFVAAKALGVDIGESERELPGIIGEYSGDGDGAWVLVSNAYDAVKDALGSSPVGQLKRERKRMIGYSWYDSLPCVEEITADIGNGHADVLDEPFYTAPDGVGRLFNKVPKIELRVIVSDGRTWTQHRKCLSISTYGDMSISTYGDSYADNLDDGRRTIMLAEAANGADVVAIAGYLQDALFVASDVDEADSYETQEEKFFDEISAMIAEAIGGEEAGLRAEMEACLRRDMSYNLRRDNVRWSIHKDWDGEPVLNYVQIKPEEPKND